MRHGQCGKIDNIKGVNVDVVVPYGMSEGVCAGKDAGWHG